MAEMRFRVITIMSRKTAAYKIITLKKRRDRPERAIKKINMTAATETPDSEFESDKSSPFPSRMANYGMEADAYICPKKQMHDAPAFRSS